MRNVNIAIEEESKIIMLLIIMGFWYICTVKVYGGTPLSQTVTAQAILVLSFIHAYSYSEVSTVQGVSMYGSLWRWNFLNCMCTRLVAVSAVEGCLLSEVPL